jgi:TP901 family phage tail tape measure protein
MSDFIAKITATVDTTKAAAQLNALTKERKINVQANVNGNGVDNLNSSIQQAQKGASGLSASFKEIAGAKLKYDAINAIKTQADNAVKAVTDLNQAMTLVNMTMSSMTDASLNSLKQQSLNMARELSTYTKNVTDAVTIYANENESAASMLAKTQPTVLLSAASGMNASTAADAIQGIMNQFGMAEDQAMHVADTVEKLSSEIALDFSQGCDTISKSIATSGSVVNEAGMSFEKYAALVSTTAEKTRVSGSQIGNAFKTIFSRISRSKDGLTTDAEMSDAEAALKSVGVSVRGADGDLRDISDTLDDLNKVWGTLNHSQKSYVSEQAAGVRQKNIFIAAMDSYNKALQLEQDALDSNGTAMEINDKRADSINGKLEKLSATMTKLYSDALPEEALEGMLDFATSIASVVDNLGLLQGAIAALGVAGGSQVFSLIASNWSKLLTAFTSPVGIASFAVGGAVAAISAYRKSVEEMIQSAKQAGDEWKSGQESLQGQIDKITELRTALDSGTLSEQEAASTKSELLSIQESLTDSYGKQVAGIDLINGSLTEQIELLDKVSQKEAESYKNENKKAIKKAEKEMEKDDRKAYLGSFYDNGTDESEAIKTSIKKLQDKYGDDVLVSELNDNGITVDVRFVGDAATEKEVMNDFMTEMEEIEDTYKTGTADLMSDYASDGLKKADKVIDKYQDIYEAAKKADLVSDDYEYMDSDANLKTASEWLRDYTKAIDDYNTALASGDYAEIEKAKTAFDDVNGSVSELLLNTDMGVKYGDVFGEAKSQLDQATISANNFKNALSDKGNTRIQGFIDELKDLNLTDTDFKYALETDGIQDGEDAVNGLSDAAERAGVSTDQLISWLVDLGAISESTGSSVDNTAQTVADLTTQIDSTSTALASIQKATSILTSQSAGKSISIDDFNSDELKDYTSALEYNNGVLHLNAEKVQELQKAKAEEAIQTNENQKLEKQSQYMENIAQIEQLQDELRGLSDAKSENAQAIQDSIDALLSENDGIVNQCNQLDLLSASLREATGAYQNWLNKQNGSESGDMFDDAMGALSHIEDVTQNTESDDYGRIGKESYKAAVEFLIPDKIDSQDAEAVSSYIDSIEHYFNHDSEGNRTGLDVAEFCAKATKAGLMELDEASGDYKVAGQRTMEDFAEGLNLSLPMVQAMFGEMEEFDAHFDWANESIKTLGDLGVAAGEAKKNIESIDGNKDLDIQIDVSDIDSTEDKISTLDNTIQQMQNYKGTVDLDSSQVDDANTVIQYCVTQKQMLEAPAVMSVDASQVDGELGNAISLLQQFKEAQNNVELQSSLDVNADTSEAQAQVDSLASEIDGLSPEIKATLGIDTTSEATITSSIEALTPKMMVKAGVDSSLVDAYAAEEKKSQGKVDWDNNTGKVDSWAAQMHTSNGQVIWTNETSQVKTTFTATGTVNWRNANAPSKGSGGANGTAHADGTAHLPHLVGHANAQGNWGTKTGGLTLVGELGREIVVDPGSGTWHTVGDNGAEFTYIPAGSIVFNHLQSESLLERGFVNSRAKGMSNVTGTAMVTGHIPIKQANIASGNTTYKGSSGSSSSGSSSSGSSSGGSTAAYRANTNSVNANTSATDSNTKSAKESKSTIDFVKIKLDRLANTFEYAANQITDYVSSAFKTAVLKKQMKIIDKQLTANQEAYDTYMNKANSVGLSEEYKKLVKNGALKIEDIDTSTDSGKKLSENIKDFQSYYESAIECKNTIQELNNKLLELYDTLANMPIEKAEKAIDKLKSKYESLDNVYGAISGGGSTLGHLQDQIKKDNPTLANAQKNLDKATTARNKTKSTRSKASKNLKSATTDVEKTGTNLINVNKKQTSSIAKKLKKAAKSTTDNATYNTIARAIREGKSISTKGLKGEALKYAKSYNKSLKQGNTIASKVKAGKTVSTSGMTSTLKAKAKKYNTDAKEKNEAQKEYDKAKKADEKALKKLNTAKDTKNKAYSGSTKEQQILATTNGKKAYVYQNMLLTQETRNLKEQNKQRQSALKQVNKNYNDALKNSNSANASKKSAQKKLLSDKSVTSKLTKKQKAALEAGKKVSTTGISDPKVLKKIEAYNKKVANATDLSKKLKIQEDALADATKEAANAEAEYAQSIVENAKKKLDNIAAYYDSFMSQWENRSSMIETYMDRMQTQGYNLSTKFYEAQIEQEQSIVDNLSEKYKAMKRNFEAAVQNGDITKGTQEYYEMKDSVDQVANSLAEAENKVFELQASIRDLKWEQFDQLQDSISRITSESDFLIDLMSHKDMFDDDGKMTEQGLATLGLHGVNYNTYMAQADKYKEEMLRISEELAKDPYNQKLIDRKNELVDAQQKSILSAENEKDAMKDLIKDGIENELDSLQDLIDKYLDAIQAQKDLYDYQKKIREKTEEIASLQKQLASLQGDNSEENKAKLQELKNSIKDAQEDLEDTQYEKFISDQKELLDNLKNEYEEILNKRLDNIDGLLSDMISEINSNASQISDTLRTEAASVGYDLSTEMQNVWNATNDVNGVIAAYDSNFSSTMTGVSSAIDDIYKRQQEMINAIDSMAGKLVQKVQEETADPVVGELEEVKQKPNKNNVAEGNPTPDPPKVSDKDSIKDAVLVDPDEPKKKPKKKPNKTNGTNAGNGKAEVGDKVTYTSGVYHAASDGTGATGSYYLGKKVKITRINKGSKYPYCIDAADGTQLGWVKLSQLKGYASGSKSIPSDQYGWTQELGTESLIRKRDGAIVTPFERGDMVLDADATKNLWDMMNDPSGFINGAMPNISQIISGKDRLRQSNTTYNQKIEFILPNVENYSDFMRKAQRDKKFERMICDMTTERMVGGNSLRKYRHSF